MVLPQIKTDNHHYIQGNNQIIFTNFTKLIIASQTEGFFDTITNFTPS